MKWFNIKIIFPLICLLVSLFLAEALVNRKIRNKNYSRTPLFQLERNPLKKEPHPHLKQFGQKKEIKSKIKNRQFIVPFARPTPVGLFSNNLARAFLIPAIPTLIGDNF